VLSDLSGVSGMAIVQAILEGERREALRQLAGTMPDQRQQRRQGAEPADAESGESGQGGLPPSRLDANPQ